MRDHWTDKTQRERELWAEKFQKASEAVLKLMRDAPRTPDQWGIPSSESVRMDAECDTLADALEAYRDQVRVDCKPKQIVKKPGDSKAARAEFVMRMRDVRMQDDRLSAQDVATIASVVFNDETIDDRLVRRLTSSRADSCES